MIKKSLLWFIVWFVWLLSFSYWVDLSQSLPWSFYMWNINNIIWKDLNLANSDWWNWLYNTDYWCSRSLFWVSWRLYFYFYCWVDSFYQWYFSKACKIYSSWWVLEASSCNESDYTLANLEEFYSLTWYDFTRYSIGDFSYYYANQICFYNSNNHYYYCFSRQNLNSPLGIVWNEIDFSQYAWWSPFWDWFDPLSPWIADNVDLSWNLLYSDKCTNWYIVAKLHDLYWTDWLNICYAWSFDNSLVSWTWNYQFSYNTWYTLKEVFENTSDWTYWYFNNYSDWYNSWSDSIYRYKIWQVAWNPFVWTPVYLYTYFNNLFNNWRIYPKSSNAFFILNYCNLALYSDYNQVYQGSYFQEYCDTIPWWRVNSWNDNLTWDSLWNIVGVSRNWILSGADEDFNWTTFINEFFQKLSWKFERPVWSLFWIIPNYILVFMFALILFRFLQH